MDSLADLGRIAGFGLTWTGMIPGGCHRQRADFGPGNLRSRSLFQMVNFCSLVSGQVIGYLKPVAFQDPFFRAEETDRPRNIGQASSQQFAAGFQQLLVTGLPIGIVEKEIA